MSLNVPIHSGAPAVSCPGANAPRSCRRRPRPARRAAISRPTDERAAASRRSDDRGRASSRRPSAVRRSARARASSPVGRARSSPNAASSAAARRARAASRAVRIVESSAVTDESVATGAPLIAASSRRCFRARRRAKNPGRGASPPSVDTARSAAMRSRSLVGSNTPGTAAASAGTATSQSSAPAASDSSSSRCRTCCSSDATTARARVTPSVKVASSAFGSGVCIRSASSSMSRLMATPSPNRTGSGPGVRSSSSATTSAAYRDRVAISTERLRSTASRATAQMAWVLPVPGAPDTTVSGWVRLDRTTSAWDGVNGRGLSTLGYPLGASSAIDSEGSASLDPAAGSSDPNAVSRMPVRPAQLSNAPWTLGRSTLRVTTRPKRGMTTRPLRSR